MPAPGMTFAAGPGMVDVEPAGRVTSVVHPARPGHSYLREAFRPGLFVIDDLRNDAEWSLVELTQDADELQLDYRSFDLPQLQLSVRHTFAVSWSVRIAFSNQGDQAISIGESWFRLSGSDWPSCALAAGAEGCYLVQPADGAGPLLAATLRRGAVHQVSAQGIDCGSIVLEAGGRYIVQWQLDWFDSPAQLASRYSNGVPTNRFLALGESVLVGDGDTAVITPEELEHVADDESCELLSEVPGRFPVELRSARGITRFDLVWVPAFDQAISDTAALILQGERNPSGVIKISSVEEALVLQRGLVENLITDPDEAAEALDLHTANLLDRANLGPLEICFLSREYGRDGDEELLTTAVRSFQRLTHNSSGVGTAATQLCVSQLLAGHDPAVLLAQLGQLRPAMDEPAAELELMLVARAPDALPEEELLALVLACSAEFAPGVVADPIDEPSGVKWARLVFLLGLLPDGLTRPLQEIWTITPSRFAQQLSHRLLAQEDSDDRRRGLAWLALGRTP